MKKPWESFSAVGDFYEPSLKRMVKQWVLLLPGMNMCSWYLSSCGGCTMCGFNGPASSKQQYAWVTKYFGKRALSFLYWLGYWGIKDEHPENLTIYNGGNFLNSGTEFPGSKTEIPLSLQMDICERVGRHPTIGKLFVESRPEFITENNIPILMKLLSGKTLQIGIGLESRNDFVRNVLLRKGMSIAGFERAISIIRKNGAKSLVYVFLKPVGLDEQQAVEDAVQTIRYCFEMGVDEVSLSCAFIQEGTPMHKEFLAGKYKPPRLWSIIEVLKQTTGLGPVRVGTFEDDPPPIAVPRNCDWCTDRVNLALDRYRQSFDLSVFNNLRECNCK